jgi:hypothetical protein
MCEWETSALNARPLVTIKVPNYWTPTTIRSKEIPRVSEHDEQL